MTDKRYILLVGAGSAIGSAIAVEAAARGHVLIKTSRSGGGDDISMDVRDEIHVRETIQAIISRHQVDSVVYAPAITDRCLIHKAQIGLWQSVYDVNVLGALRVAKSLLPHLMKQRNGTFLFVSSIAAVRGVVGSGAYSASKAGLNSLAKSISKEYGRFNVRAFTVMPGYVGGGMLRDLSPAEINEASKHISLRRFAAVAEIARFIVTALETPYLTGTSISIDGGMDG